AARRGLERADPARRRLGALPPRAHLADRGTAQRRPRRGQRARAVPVVGPVTRLLAAAGAIAVLAGCGGDGPKALSAAEYRRQASAICVDATRRAGAIRRPRDLAGLRRYLDQTLT